MDSGDKKNLLKFTGQRKHPRYPFIANVLLDGKMIFKSMNLSQGGMYVYTGRSYIKDTIVTISIPNDRERMQIEARVVHDRLGIGMGLAFLNLDYDQKLFINKLIMSLSYSKEMPEAGTV